MATEMYIIGRQNIPSHNVKWGSKTVLDEINETYTALLILYEQAF